MCRQQFYDMFDSFAAQRKKMLTLKVLIQSYTLLEQDEWSKNNKR